VAAPQVLQRPRSGSPRLAPDSGLAFVLEPVLQAEVHTDQVCHPERRRDLEAEGSRHAYRAGCSRSCSGWCWLQPRAGSPSRSATRFICRRSRACPRGAKGRDAPRGRPPTAPPCRSAKCRAWAARSAGPRGRHDRPQDRASCRSSQARSSSVRGGLVGATALIREGTARPRGRRGRMPVDARLAHQRKSVGFGEVSEPDARRGRSGAAVTNAVRSLCGRRAAPRPAGGGVMPAGLARG
jgi:hypothetical protein